MLKTKEVLFGKVKVLCSLQELCPMVDPIRKWGYDLLDFILYAECLEGD